MSLRTTCARPAPMARRMAMSRARAGARLTSSPPTLAHATISTASATAISIMTIGASERAYVRASSSVRAMKPRSWSVSGGLPQVRGDLRHVRRACSTVSPGLRRAFTASSRAGPSREVCTSSGSPGSTLVNAASGT
jgi:hypothetical protein